MDSESTSFPIYSETGTIFGDDIHTQMGQLMSEMRADGTPENPRKVSARVLGCLRTGWVNVLLYPGIGLADGGVPMEIPEEIVPLELRFPNKEFDLAMVQTPEGLQPIECFPKS